MFVKFEFPGPREGAGFSPELECEARGNGMLSREGVELTM